MKAYKCNLCNKYCDDVITIHGIAKPHTFQKYEHLEGKSADCCEECYNAVMERISKIIENGGKQNET